MSESHYLIVGDFNDAVGIIAYLGHRTHDDEGKILPAVATVARGLIGQRHNSSMPSFIAYALSKAEGGAK